jgi:hypothetical protein
MSTITSEPAPPAPAAVVTEDAVPHAVAHRYAQHLIVAAVLLLPGPLAARLRQQSHAPCRSAASQYRLHGGDLNRVLCVGDRAEHTVAMSEQLTPERLGFPDERRAIGHRSH